MYLLSLCIPTYNRADHLEVTLKSICEQSEFNSTQDIEIVISDNNSSDHTESVCKHFVELYGGKIKYFKNTTNIADRNFELALSRGKGILLKLNNDTLIHRKNSLAEISRTIRDNVDKKPVLFFSNGKAHSGKTQQFDDLDSFLTHISFYCTWIGGFCIWKDDFDHFDNFSRLASKQLMQTDVLFRLVDKKRISVVNDKKLFDTSPVTRGGYDFLNVFIVNYIDILEKYFRENKISNRTFSNEKLRLLIYQICPWVARSKQKYNASYDVSEHWNYLFGYFSNNPKAIILYCLSYFAFNVKYFLTRNIRYLWRNWLCRTARRKEYRHKVTFAADAVRLASGNPGFGASDQSTAVIPSQSDSASKQPGQILPKVAILLCTYQGQRYLAEQLDSFAAQTLSNWEVWASDDGSQDDTHSILEIYQQKWGSERLLIFPGAAEGFVANFLSLVYKVSIHADFYAYSDQDDIWEADRLQRAVDWLLTIPRDVPALYCSRTRLINAKNQVIGFSQLFTKPPGFANALIQNVAGGNTMVFNNAARKLLREAGKDVDIVLHDWWTYLVISGCGGKVFYDSYPSLRYRQHSDNLVGMDSGWATRLVRRIYKLWRGQSRSWNDQHILALQRLRSKLMPENLEILDQFSVARNRWLLPRLIGLKRSGIYRQTLLSNLRLVAETIFKKI